MHARWQHLRNGLVKQTLPAGQDRQCAFRPDQQVNASQGWCLSVNARAGHVKIPGNVPLHVCAVPFFLLRYIRLHDSHLEAGVARFICETGRSVNPAASDGHGHKCTGQPVPADNQNRQPGPQQDHKTQTIDSRYRCPLRQGPSAQAGNARRIPRKACKYSPAHPLKKAQHDNEKEQARCIRFPQHHRAGTGCAPKQRQPGRHCRYCQRQQHGKGSGINQKGKADPVKRCEEIPEPVPPASQER